MSAALDEDDWVDQRTVRKVQTHVRQRRSIIDDLERQRCRGVVTGADAAWTVWTREAKLTALRAEFEYWQGLLNDLQRRQRSPSMRRASSLE